MAEGFEVASAYIEVDLEDNTERDRDKIEAKTLGWGRVFGKMLGKQTGDEFGNEFTRDANGRLHDGLGRYVAEGRRAGAGFRLGFGRGFLGGLGGIFAPLGRSIPLVAALGSMMGKQLVSSLKYAAFAGLAQLGVELVGALAPMLGALALLPAAIATAVTGLIVFKMALSGVGDALKAGLSGDMAKLNEALKKLAPNAQAFVKQVVALKDAWSGLRKEVQNQFFAGLDTQLKALSGALLPVLSARLPTIAAGINQVIRDSMGVLTLPKVIDNVSVGFRDLGLGLTNMLGILPGLIQGLTTLVRVGAGFLPALTSGFADLGQKFAQFMDRVTASGQLQAFISGGLSALGDLLKILGQIGSILVSVFTAAGVAGGGLLQILGNLLSGLTLFLQTAQGMAALQAIFGALAVVGNALGGALSTILPVLGGVLVSLLPLLAQVVATLAPALASIVTAIAPLLGLFNFIVPLVQALTPLLPVIAQLAQIIGSGLANAIGAIMPGVAALAQALTSALGPILPVLTQLFATLAPILGQIASVLAQLLAPVLAIVSDLLVQLGPVIGVLAETLGKVLVVALDALLPLFQALVPVIADWARQVLPALIPLIIQLGDLLVALMPAIKPLIGLLVALLPLMTNTEGTKAMIGILVILAKVLTGVVRVISQVVGWIANAVHTVDAWRPVGQFFVNIWDTISGAFSRGVEFIRSHLETIVGFIVALPGRIFSALTQLPDAVGRFISQAFDQLMFTIGFVLGSIVRFMFELPGRIAAALQSLGQTLRNIWDTAWATVKQVVFSAGEAIWNYIMGLPGRISAALNALPGLLSAIWSKIWNTAKSAFSAGVDAVANYLNSLPGRAVSAATKLKNAILGALSSAGSWLLNAGGNLVDGLINGVEGAIGRAIDTVKRAMKKIVDGAKHALGIGSPSRVFAAQVGHWIPAGVGEGVRRNINAARDAIRDMLAPPSVPPPMLPAYAGAAGGVASAGAGVAAPAKEPTILHAIIQVGDRVLGEIWKEMLDDHPEDVAAATDEGRRTRGWVHSPRAKS